MGENGFHFLQKQLEIEWLVYEIQILPAVWHKVGVTGRQDNGDVWMQFANGVGKFKSRHAWHQEVGNNQPHLGGVLV